MDIPSTLERAVKMGDLEKIKYLAQKEEVDRGDLLNAIGSCGPITQNQVPIIKLLMDDEFTVHTLLKQVLLTPRCPDHIAQELVSWYLIHQNKNDNEVFRTTFNSLLDCKDFVGPPAVKILELLLDHGFSVNDFYDVFLIDNFVKITPLHHCILNKRFDFVSNKFHLV